MYKVLYSNEPMPVCKDVIDGELFPTIDLAYSAIIKHNKSHVDRIAIYKRVDQQFAVYMRTIEYEVSEPRTVVVRDITKVN